MIKLKLALVVCGFLAVAIGHNLNVVAQQPQPKPQYAAVLTVKHMCCAKESVPAIKELSRIPGVKRVAVDYKTRSLYIEQSNVAPSPQGLWDAAARIQIEPVRLATPEGVYTTRPLR
jgi:copper chaperone CopZ